MKYLYATLITILYISWVVLTALFWWFWLFMPVIFWIGYKAGQMDVKKEHAERRRNTHQ